MPDNPQTPAPASETPANGETPQTQELNFDTWLAAQEEPIKKLIDSHTGGLRSALETERTQRKDLTRQLKDVSGKLDANSEAAKQLGALSSTLEEAQQRADFYETLGAGCLNPKLAYLAYKADGLKSIEQLRAAYPQLFAKATPPATHAGNGTNGGQPGNGAASMNDFIRRSAGVKS